MMTKKIYIPILIVVLLVVGGFPLLTKIAKEAKRSKQIEQEIENLRTEARKIENNNNFLQKQIAYFNSDDYKEKIGKGRLNLKKPGEEVVVVRPSKSRDVLGKSVQINKSNLSENISNQRRWWRKFFE